MIYFILFFCKDFDQVSETMEILDSNRKLLISFSPSSLRLSSEYKKICISGNTCGILSSEKILRKT